ncbi:MAG TPA: hypothetical protein VGQ87_01085 [Patescibacteria group bacterium]|jgi:hypothetical protein|nr:hypothetical protein [Patescibacteria group bacterium]
MNRRPEGHPSFNFDETGDKPAVNAETPAKPLTEREREYQDALTSGVGWCGDCDQQLGTGSCVRCQRIRSSNERKATASDKSKRKK